MTRYWLIFSRTNAVVKFNLVGGGGLFFVCVCVLKSNIYNLSAVCSAT